MAGGPYARKVVCDVCRAAGVRAVATRVREGSETDGYACAHGHEFAIHWRQIPDAPMWPEPSREEIARAAYFRWLARGGGPSDDAQAQNDWILAERDLGSDG